MSCNNLLNFLLFLLGYLKSVERTDRISFKIFISLHIFLHHSLPHTCGSSVIATTRKATKDYINRHVTLQTTKKYKSRILHLLWIYIFTKFLCPVYFTCVLYYCHRVATQLQLTNISYHIDTILIITVASKGTECASGSKGVWKIFNYTGKEIDGISW